MSLSVLSETEIVRRLQAGESQRAVARATGLNPVTVGRIGKRAGLTFPRGQRSATARTGQSLRLTEKHFLQQVIDLAHILGYRAYHTWSSIHSEAGFPDLVLVRPGPEPGDGRGRLIFAELKTDSGEVMPAQQVWLDDLGSCAGAEVYLWRPAHWDEIVKTLQEAR